MGEAVTVIKKICLLGDPAVGKTSLIRKYVYDEFDDKYITTIGTKVTKKQLDMEKGGTTYRLSMLIWDILGQKEFMAFHKTYYQGAEGALIVCDGSRVETQKSLPRWIESFMSAVGNVPIIFLINKFDLVNQDEFDTSYLDQLAQTHSTIYLYTSAKDGMNVEKAFEKISDKLIQ